MNIAILTFSHAINRGAHMQCYALAKMLQELGHAVTIIHIKLPSGNLNIKGRILATIVNFKNEQFRKKYYPSITKPYNNAAELRASCPIADAYIVGSDQVWNPSITGSFGAESFFFDFVPPGKRKIAYAASFGVSKWQPSPIDKKIEHLLQQFDAISVRELNGIEICRETFGIANAQAVLDPVFLIKDYSNITGSSVAPKRQVMYYPLIVDETIRYTFLSTATELRLSPLSFSTSVKGKGIQTKLFSSIPEWLRNIKSSAFIITNSFHCLAFSIIFNKPFIATPPAKGKEARILSILKQLNLENRYVRSKEEFLQRKEELFQPIDYKTVNQVLDHLRAQSIEFITQHL